MNQSFSEYVLYEPILRILTARGFTVKCEVECPGVEHASTGDRRRLDFVAKNGGIEFALEVKWARGKRLRVKRDLEKLEAYLSSGPGAKRSFLCVFGRNSILQNLQPMPKGAASHLRERGKVVTADFGKTRYSCRVYELEGA